MIFVVPSVSFFKVFKFQKANNIYHHKKNISSNLRTTSLVNAWLEKPGKLVQVKKKIKSDKRVNKVFFRYKDKNQTPAI